MLHFLLSVTTTAIILCLGFGILMGYTVQRQLWEMRAPAKRGLYAGTAIAVIVAILELTTAVLVREFYNLYVLTFSVVFTAALLVYLFSKRNSSSESIVSKPLACIFFCVTAAWAAYYLPDIFLYPSHFAVGTVTVFSTEFVLIVTGYVLGLILILFSGYAVFAVTSALSCPRLNPVFFLSMLTVFASQLVVILQTLVGRNLIPRKDWILDITIFLVGNENVFRYTLFALCLAASVFLWVQSRSTVIEGENPAIKRKGKSLLVRRVRWSKAVILATVACFAVIIVGGYFGNKEVELSPPKHMTAEEGVLLIPLETVNDGTLHRFSYTSKMGVEVRFIVIKKSESAYGVGLDACDVCGPSGYYQRKGEVVCILCDVVMNIKTIGFAGGCNPVPLKFSIRDGMLHIETKHLEAEAPRFM